MLITNNLKNNTKGNLGRYFDDVDEFIASYKNEDTTASPPLPTLKEEDATFHYNMDETLKKIDISMQSLIKEAQASLSQPFISSSMQDNITSCRRILNKGCQYYCYHQQRKLQSPFNHCKSTRGNYNSATAVNSIHHYHHHHYRHSNSRERLFSNSSKKWYWPVLLGSILTIADYSSVLESKSIYGGLWLVILSFITFFYRKQHQFPVLNSIDRLMFRIIFSKGRTPALLGCLHRFNIAYLCVDYLFS